MYALHARAAVSTTTPHARRRRGARHTVPDSAEARGAAPSPSPPRASPSPRPPAAPSNQNTIKSNATINSRMVSPSSFRSRCPRCGRCTPSPPRSARRLLPRRAQGNMRRDQPTRWQLAHSPCTCPRRRHRPHSKLRQRDGHPSHALRLRVRHELEPQAVIPCNRHTHARAAKHAVVSQRLRRQPPLPVGAHAHLAHRTRARR